MHAREINILQHPEIAGLTEKWNSSPNIVITTVQSYQPERMEFCLRSGIWFEMNIWVQDQGV